MKRLFRAIASTGTLLILALPPVAGAQGSILDAVVTLTAGDKGVDASIEFASGAAQFVGTAVKNPAVAR